MWYRQATAEINHNIIQQWNNRINALRNITNPEAKDAAIAQLMHEFFESGLSTTDYYDTIYRPLRELDKENDAILRQKTGEPDLDFSDVQSFPAWIVWKEQSGNLTEYDIPYLMKAISDNYSIYGDYVAYRPRYGGQSRTLPREEAEFIKNLRQQLQDRAFQLFNIDRNQLSDPELWDIEPHETYEGTNLSVSKHVDWRPNDPDAEGTIITFSADPAGIGILSEVSDPMPVALQKQELQKFLNDVKTQLPANWSKDIKYVEGGDFKDILEGKLDRDIKVYRMMSDEEYEAWLRGAEIPAGKFFATRRDKASGTDFGNEGFRDIFSFIVNRSLLSGEDENVMKSAMPLKLEGKRLIPYTPNR